MASCVRNIHAKNYQNLIIGFQVTVVNVGDVFWDTVYYQNIELDKLLTLASGVDEIICNCKQCSRSFTDKKSRTFQDPHEKISRIFS